MNKVVFVVQQLSQPRCIKRIECVCQAGIPVSVYGFDNGLYNDSLNKLPFPVEKIVKRDKVDNKIKKISFFIKLLRSIFRENEKEDLYYFFGYELGLLAYILGCDNYMYEEADVVAARAKNKVIQKIMLMFDKKIIKKSQKTIFTSVGFVEYIYNKEVPKNKIILLPNKLNKYFDEKLKQNVKQKYIDDQHIVFGFVGLIRYPNTIVRFANVIANKFPQHEFHFYGDVERENYIDNKLRSAKNIFFHGRFINPDDLMSIYEKIDVSVVCYDVTSGNVRIAEPNKIYESIYFETPLVVSKNTYLERHVMDLGIGFAIDASNDMEIENFVSHVTKEDLNEKRIHMQIIPWQESVDDATELVECVKLNLSDKN